MARHRHTISGVSDTPENGRHRGARRRHSPVRTGLLASSAALAMGAIAMGTGVIPAPPNTPDGFSALDGDAHPSGSVEPSGNPRTQSLGSTPTAPARHRAAPTPSPSPRRSTAPPKASPKPRPSASASSGGDRAAPGRSATTPRPPQRSAPGQGDKGGSAASSAEKTAEAGVLSLVNQERAKAGCQPLAVDAKLAGLARVFSADMALRNFFDHNSPDGQSPWDRAAAVGISNLGGENIARGQADAAAVMASWMASPGHRANILNCHYRTIGIGVHFGPGGPWWTQDFGL